MREEIGFGATSVVYEAEHRTERRRVAVKVLRSAAEMQSELRWRFEREMQLCCAISSKHVPCVYDVGELPSGLPYIVMERLDGSTLADWLAFHRRLPVPVVVEIGIQACAALTCLHELDVAHRDVKPENLVLARASGSTHVVKLVDFGICKPLAGDARTTQQGLVVGTPEYMSPEQVQGIELDLRTDVYSLGVVLFELLTGSTPFEGRDLERLGRAILFTEPTRPCELRPEVSGELESIVMRAMARDRSSRHPSTSALGAELERLVAASGMPTDPDVWDLLPDHAGLTSIPPVPPGMPPPRLPRATLLTRRVPLGRAGLLAGVAAAVAVLAVAALSVVYLIQVPAGRPRPSPPALVTQQRSEPAPPEPSTNAPPREMPDASPIGDGPTSSADAAGALEEPPRQRPARRFRRRARSRPPTHTTVAFTSEANIASEASAAPEPSAVSNQVQIESRRLGLMPENPY